MRQHLIIPTGTTYSRWTVIGPAHKNHHGAWLYSCRCICGVVRDVSAVALRSGASRSCGCLNKEIVSGPRTSLRDRFLQKVVKESSGCWRWTGAIGSDGYGRIWAGPHQFKLAHRVSYELFRGHIPVVDERDRALVLDHLCRNRSCVNPEHLELVTHGENVHRGISPLIEANHTQTCVRGHSYAEHSLYRDGKRIYCRTCETENQWRRRHAQTN